MKCPHCNREHPVGVHFCPVTGKPIPTQSQPLIPRQPAYFSCSSCGTAVPTGATFCPHCGHRFESETIVEPATGLKTGRVRTVLPIGLGLVGVVALVLVLTALYHQRLPSIASAFTGEQPTLTPQVATGAIQTAPAEDGATAVQPMALASETLGPAPTAVRASETPTVAFTKVPTATLPPTVTATEEIRPVDTRINLIDQAEMVFVPAGEFLMGSDAGTDPYFWGAEGPSHRVYMDGYWIYRYEVTNAMYQACVSAGSCPLPAGFDSRTRKDYYKDSDYANYPVIHVNYVDALSYCRWTKGQLPTEAEWEKAGRGDQDDRLFPWGWEPATESHANFCDRNCSESMRDSDKDDGYADTAPIGSYPNGMSPYGVYDMAGNVWEWVMDYFNAGYYQVSPEKNPVGPQSSLHRVIRGGGWNNPSAGVRVVQREGVRPQQDLDTLGFRCVIEAE